MSQNQLTVGGFADEAAACRYFDAVFAKPQMQKLWRVFREVEGQLLHVKPQQRLDKESLRIDRIIVPNPDNPWTEGPFGVEIKRSWINFNNAINQAADYTRSAWRLPRNFTVIPRFVFIFPMERQTGFTESAMVRDGLGTASPRDGGLVFHFNTHRMMAIGRDNGQPDFISDISTSAGLKIGSR